MSYVELHCHSNYSFQEGASSIDEMVSRAVELGYPALALTDHDNLCGTMEFAQVARSLDIQPAMKPPGIHTSGIWQNRSVRGFETCGTCQRKLTKDNPVVRKCCAYYGLTSWPGSDKVPIGQGASTIMVVTPVSAGGTLQVLSPTWTTASTRASSQLVELLLCVRTYFGQFHEL